MKTTRDREKKEEVYRIPSVLQNSNLDFSTRKKKVANTNIQTILPLFLQH